LRGENKSDTSAYIEGANVHTVEHKLCMSCDVSVVICVLSTAELLKKRLISSHAVEKGFIPLGPREPRILWVTGAIYHGVIRPVSEADH